MPILRSFSAQVAVVWATGLILLLIPRIHAVPANDMRSEYLLQSWNKERGLPDNTIQAITQTTDGYVWVATRGGLARFDGTKFTVFNRANSPEMPSDDCRCLAPDQDGSLWIGTAGGLLRWADGRFSTWLTRGPRNRSCEIDAVYVSPQTGVWIGSRFALYQLYKGATPRQRITQGDLEYINSIAEDHQGVLWLGNLFGVWRFDPRTNEQPLKVVPNGSQTNRFVVDGIQTARDGTLWVAVAEFLHTNDMGPYLHWIYGLKNGRWSSLPCNPVSNMGRRSFVAQDNDGALWMPHGTAGLVRYLEGHASNLSFSPEIGACALCLFCDREDNLWVGTEHSGLLRYRRKGVMTLSTKEGLADDNTWTICEARDGSVWIGTDGGVSRLTDGQFSTFTQKEGLTKNTVRSIIEDSSGTIWVGTGRGLNSYHDGQWRHVPLPPNDVAGNKIRVLYADRAGDLWVGREYGLARIHAGEFVPLPEPQQLAGLDVRAVLRDRSGGLWIGNYGEGLLRIVGDRIDRFSLLNGLASSVVWAIHEDAAATLWLGTDRGLHRYRDGRFVVFTERDGLFDRGVNQILEDDFQNLWIGCERGIYRVSKEELDAVAEGRLRKVSCVTYGTGDGLLGAETNGQRSNPAACKTRDGRLWFSTSRGVAVFDPRKLPDNLHPPQTVIERIRADGAVIYHNGPSTREAAHLSLAPEVELPPGTAHVLEIDYTSNTMVETALVNFKYLLERVDRDWIEAGTRRTATYAHLAPGHYRFHVKAINKYGVASEQASSFGFYLKPYFYQTWIFYLGCGALLGAAGFSVYRWRLSYLHRIHGLEKAKALAEDRARIARDLHDSLGAQLTNLAVLASVSEQATSAVNIETRFRKLARLARETALELKEIIWANHPGDETLEGLATRICQYTQQSLGAAGLRCSFDIAAEFPSESLMPHARHHLHLAAKEAIHNVLKHASATELRLHLEVRDERLHILIEDNGLGPAELSRGNGLANMRCRIEALNGTFSLSPRRGGGTSIRFDVPVGSLFSAADLHIVNARPRHHNAHDDESLHR
jgi:ligand-binding sensor domain-containing protein/signal transduction histidine kinase